MANINNKEFILSQLLVNKRLDGRECFQMRKVDVIFGSPNTGAIELSIGDTRVRIRI
jgi:exosome complex RNA-binding protein Rrp42 (RNase PH superfamily)